MTDNNIYKYIPNFITLLCLSSGFTSIMYSLNNEWKIAIYLILIATIFDFFDGWFARKLKTDSNFGAELDSLSDFISFGVAPSILIYMWSTFILGSLGWATTLFFVICASLRLARFTADIYVIDKPINSNDYFIGVPSPAAAGLLILPLLIYCEFELSILKNAYLNLVNTILIAFLMISRIPTISLKKISIKNKFKTWILLFLVIVTVALISNLWVTLSVILIIYILSIFYTIIINKKTN
ncbi:MAG: hypothetical protein CFH15_01399 [Alphaproteobacteria bacterium MarineAlpha5_Bin5]|nr:MAG: hypothetical protein CFH15_01399 [Alphaproteobacteria bacterium MarineAlpha5_Bin5]PPR50844.1 MAG: hypothetical protein CFH14_00821 [Alphaproteobacteria bacterium MarineAlpha5_Bin4]|tara:strand:- start:14886 stop:15605 length:720 start_codon:yes stop_codon:yes gene_type:complete